MLWTGRLNNKHLLFIVQEAGKTKIKVLADLVSGEGSLPGFQMAIFLLYLHFMEKKEKVSPWSLPIFLEIPS